MSGPYATAMLADLGAEVLKIESIGSGDLSRVFGPHVGDESAYALMLNRGKESLTVDLKHEAGRQLILDLAAKSDVVVENFRPGVAARLGLDYDILAAAFATILPLTAAAQSEGPFSRLVIRDAMIIPGHGGPPYGPADIIIENYVRRDAQK